MSRPRIGLALGSGGARGWCHVGVLRGLAGLGIRPDLIAGCSMGAVVGAAWCAGRLDALEAWGRRLDLPRLVGLLDIRLSRGGLLEGAAIEATLRDVGVPAEIEALDTPFAAVATDLATGREIWLREGPLLPAVRASAAIPGILAPLHKDGMWLLDGGLTNPIPVSLARAMGAEVIIAVNPNGRREGRFWQAQVTDAGAGGGWRRLAQRLPAGLATAFGPTAAEADGAGPAEAPPHYLDVMSTAIDVMTDRIRRARLAGEPPDLLLEADLSDLSVLDLHRAAPAISVGEALVADHADRLRRLCGAPGGAAPARST